MHVHFAEPRWLWAGGVACLALAMLLLRAARARARAVALLGGQRAVTSVSPGRRRLKQALTLIGTAALFVALARPQAGFRLCWRAVLSRAGGCLIPVGRPGVRGPPARI